MPRPLSEDVFDRLLRGDRRAAARLITAVEAGPDSAASVVRRIHEHTGRAHIIGITGSPGAGKSTLVDGIVDTLREAGLTVGVIAVDPSSPFTGGALLGDRIRMQKRSTDKDVFIRSMGSRGYLGGVASATSDAVKVLDALGKDVILIETVGVGQAEVDIVKMADTTVVVLVPGMGDEIQSIKAGIMEIGDLFVVNKADRDGADKTVAEIEMMLMMGLGSEDPRKRRKRQRAEDEHHGGHGEPERLEAGERAQAFMEEDTVHLAERRTAPRRVRTAGDVGADEDAKPGEGASEVSFFEQLLEAGVWYPPVVKTIAEKAHGIAGLVDLMRRHLTHIESTGEREKKRAARAERELLAHMREQMLQEVEAREHLRKRFGELVQHIAGRSEDPHTAAAELIRHYKETLGSPLKD